MRIKSAFFALIFGLPLHAALGQAATPSKGSFLSHTEVALLYDYVRSETVGYNYSSGTFALSGVSAAAAYKLRPHLSAVADFSGTHVNGVENSGRSLTLLISQVGGRYTSRPFLHVRPFGEVLAGEAHAGGSIYPANNVTSGEADSYALTAGAGADYDLSSVVSLRGQADYLLTGLPNAGNNRQNDLRIGAGFVFRFGGR
jgi:peptidoglycan-associated lipoprotein